MSADWTVASSNTAKGTTNPIREIVDKLDFNNLPKNKELISLSIGDPTKFGNLPVPKAAVKSILEVLSAGDNNGYGPSFGLPKARTAIAERYSQAMGRSDFYGPMDVYLGSGCSDVINLTMCALMDAGDNILVPAPGFSLYETICGRYGFEPKFYNLDPARQWEVDIESLEAAYDERTKCILLNNPSNPCGSVWSREHIERVCQWAYEKQLPIIADEIYADMVFKGETFTSAREVTTGPVFVLGGLAKQWLAPGWRVGWGIIHDPEHKLDAVRGALISLTQVILGANTICQAAIPAIFRNTPKNFYSNLNTTLNIAANILYDAFEANECLNPVKPQGAMYIMVGIEIEKLHDIDDDIQFCAKLLAEEAVACLPGTIFKCPNFFRTVVCPPPNQLRYAAQRIQDFCDRHSTNNTEEEETVNIIN